MRIDDDMRLNLDIGFSVCGKISEESVVIFYHIYYYNEPK